MNMGNRYKVYITVSFILLILCAVIVLIGLWNNISLNPEVRSGEGLYFPVIAILLLASAIYIFHLLEDREVHQETAPEKPVILPEKKPEPSLKSGTAPYEVDIDELVETIIPRLDRKEPLAEYAEKILINLSKQYEIVQAVFYLKNRETQEFESVCTYAYTAEAKPAPFRTGDGIPGQVAKDKRMLILNSLPEGYLQIRSGLGRGNPTNLILLPLMLNKETIAIMEMASFHPVNAETEWIFKNLGKVIGNAIIAKIKSTEKK
jgi:hypothetical protein